MQQLIQSTRSALAALGWLHDTLTRLCFVLAAMAVATMIAFTGIEVSARYFLGGSTQWTTDSAVIALAASIFLAAPEITRLRGHIAMTFVVESVPRRLRVGMTRVIYLIGAATCLMMGWVAAMETLRLYERGVAMITATAWPKWWVIAIVTYGLVGMGLYFLRFLCLPGSALANHTAEGDGTL